MSTRAMIDLSAEEMVDWANANMERVEELEKTVERLNDANDALIEIGHKQAERIERLQARVDVLEDAIEADHHDILQKALAATEQGGEWNV